MNKSHCGEDSPMYSTKAQALKVARIESLRGRLLDGRVFISSSARLSAAICSRGKSAIMSAAAN